MAYERFNATNAAMLLIDHQVGTMQWMHSGPTDVMKRNTVALAKAASVTGMPVVLTSSQEDQVQGPLFPELEELLPDAFASRIKRAGVVDCFDDPAFADAVRATGRTKLILAGLLTEVCVVYPALNATLGYPFNRTGCRLRRWITLVLARTIRGPWASSRPGSAPMRTVLDYLEWL